jgi:2-keto-4-pentenoate hydratase
MSSLPGDLAQPSGSAAAEAALTRREHLRLADVLLRAADDRHPIVPLSESYPELTATDAARIRDTAIVRRIASGAEIIGVKVSLGPGSSHAGSPLAPSPRLGWLTDEMLLRSPTVELSELIRPRVEAKVGFVLARRLRSRIGSVADLLELTARVIPCLEVLDVRYRSTEVDLVDDIADNCAASRLLTGPGVPTPRQAELLGVRVCLRCDADTEIFTQAISPARATLWLANRVIEERGELEPGAMLVSSACCPAVELVPGLRVSADFGALGCLELSAVSA